ncbi:molecular chaperone [Providencia rettgeri]|uniref:fimbrial biogenesis chaperone n=1 Tax=Providencia rettgeri TaxID=587 RepID=UPI0034E09FA6
MLRQLNMLVVILSVLMLNTISVFSMASTDGLKFSLQRLTYVAGEKGISVSLRNTDKMPFLIQANMKWLDESTGLNIIDKEEKIPFVVTPPLYKISPNEYYSWRIFFSGQPEQLPKDRESVFLVQLKAIPSTTYSEQALQFTVMRSLLFRVYYRPVNLKNIMLEDVAKQLVFSRERDDLIVKNNTPIYVTFNSLSVGNHALNDEQLYVSVAPYSEQRYKLPITAKGQVTWDILDENLFPTQKHSVILK